MVLFRPFINVMNHIDWFVDIDPAMHPRNKSCLIMVNNYFNVVLDLFDLYLVENFCIHFHQGTWSVALLFSGVFVWFWKEGNAGCIDNSLTGMTSKSTMQLYTTDKLFPL